MKTLLCGALLIAAFVIFTALYFLQSGEALPDEPNLKGSSVLLAPSRTSASAVPGVRGRCCCA